MSYIDTFVIPISEDALDSYKAIEKIASQVWLDHGALAYQVCVADDIDSGQTKGNFRNASSASASETVILGFIQFESKGHRDKVNQSACKDPRMKSICEQSNRPFEADRIIFGGFDVLIDLQKR
jgi:uncharacterized protein YbaA (DUF1428 family)